MTNNQKTSALLAYLNYYRAQLNRLHRYRGRDNNLIFCCGVWLPSSLSAKVQNLIDKKKQSFCIVTILLSLVLLGFAGIFYKGFAWYFFP